MSDESDRPQYGDETLIALQHATTMLRRAEQRVGEWAAERRRLVQQAAEEGCTTAQIGDACGVSSTTAELLVSGGLV